MCEEGRGSLNKAVAVLKGHLHSKGHRIQRKRKREREDMPVTSQNRPFGGHTEMKRSCKTATVQCAFSTCPLTH